MRLALITLLFPLAVLAQTGADQIHTMNPGANAVLRTQTAKNDDIVNVQDFAGADCGQQINNAYSALPSVGGRIEITQPCNISTPVVFGVSDKVATVRCEGNASSITYTPSSGTAFTWNNGILFDLKSGFEGCTLTGPGHTTSAIGIQVGGSNGAVGFHARDFKVQSFFVNVQTNSNTWITKFDHGMMRDGGTNFLMPGSGLSQAGENVLLDHVTFADAPNPHTNSVWIQGAGQQVVFESCSFDQAQLRIGDASIPSAANVTVSNSHFENPDYATGVDYDYIVEDNRAGDTLKMTNNYFLNDRPSGGAYAHFINLQGGTAYLTGMDFYSLVTVTNFIQLSNAINVQLFGFADLSGNVAALFGGSTTGVTTSLPGTDPGLTTGFNTLISSVADPIGAAAIQLGQDTVVGTTAHNHILTVNGAATINNTLNVTNGGSLEVSGSVLSDASLNINTNTISVSSVQLSDVSRNVHVNNLFIAGTCTGCPGSSPSIPLTISGTSSPLTNTSIILEDGSGAPGIFLDNLTGSTRYAWWNASAAYALSILNTSNSLVLDLNQSGQLILGGGSSGTNTLTITGSGGIDVGGNGFVNSTRDIQVRNITAQGSGGITSATCSSFVSGICIAP